MRSKEDAQDYRYFPDPDLTPISVSDEMLAEIRSKQPEFRTEKRKRYKEEFDIPDYDIEIITGRNRLQISLRLPWPLAVSRRRFLTG